MLVLVTQADGSARRLPWLSYSLALVLAAFFVLHHYGGAEGVVETDFIFAEALLYFEEHPVVELDPRLETVLGAESAKELREAYIDDRRSRGMPLLSERIRTLMQQEFDGLVVRAYERVDRLPAWRLGVRPGDNPIVSTLAHVIVSPSALALLLSLAILLLVGSALEDGWGHAIFGGFCLVAIALAAAASRGLGYYEQAGSPWIGASGLAAALLGAYFVRSLPGAPRLLGSVPLPGWLLLPVWLCAEYLLVRGIVSAEGFVPVLATIHTSCFTMGFVIGLGMMALRVEGRMLQSAVSTRDLVSNAGLERAMQARSEQRNEEAFELLQKEFRRAGADKDVALAFWDVARELGRPADAVAAALILMRGDLRAGRGESAVQLWLELSDNVTDLRVDPTLCVRMGEALLDEGHPEQAIAALGRAVDADDDLSPVMARRVVRIARDLDPDLTRSAASIALRDPQLDPGERQQLIELTRMLASGSADTAPGSECDPEPREPEAASPAFQEAPLTEPLALEDDHAPPSLTLEEPPAAAAENLDLAAPSVALPTPDVDDVDPNALSLEALHEDFARGIEGEDTEGWNQPGLLSQLGESTGEFDLDSDDLNIDPEELEQAAADAGLAGPLDCSPVETQPTEPIIEPAPAASVQAEAPAHATSVDDGEDTQGPLAGPGEDTQGLLAGPGEDTQGLLVEPASAAMPEAELRPLRIRTALPLRIEEDQLMIEVDGGGKTRLPFARIEAMGVAAVKGMAEKPVVVVDLVVNWGMAQGPMKLIRLRSDRYDPRVLVQGIARASASNPAELSALEALRIFLREVLAQSNAQPLPNAAAASGEAMVAFDSLAEYHREVLNATEPAGS